MSRVVSALIYALSGLLGIVAIIYPFLRPAAVQATTATAPAQSAPLWTAGLIGLSVVALLVELQGQSINAKMVSVLGVLVALTAILRFIDVAFPILPSGFSPVFTPILLGGYVFGARFGFLLGVFGLLVSALITGGVGPWLPYQMFAAGWAGLSAGWLGALVRLHGPLQVTGQARFHLALLSALGFVWGLLFGAVLNLYFWPFMTGAAEQTWRPGMGVADTLSRYALFYLATSLAYDLARAVGNVAMIVLLGTPVLKALIRFRRRFSFEVQRPT